MVFFFLDFLLLAAFLFFSDGAGTIGAIAEIEVRYELA